MRHLTPKAVTWTAAILAALAVVGYTVLPAADPLRVQLLDVSGFTDEVKVWMVFRVNVGLSNEGRDLLSISRVHVEPDFDGFNEAYNVGTYELNPPLRIEPGSSLTYQAAVTLLNASQLDVGLHRMMLRVRIDGSGRERTYDFPAEFQHSHEPKARALRY